MKLYYSPGACSMAPRIALMDAGMTFDSVKVDLRAKKTATGEDYLKINPKGYVPALVLDDGKMLTEVAAILQWISDKNPEKNLLPAWGKPERYEAIEVINYIATEVHKGLGQLFNPALPEDAKKITKDRLAVRLKYLETQFETKKFTLGNQYSLADAYLFTILCWSKPVNFDLSPYPKLMGFWEMMKARPTVQAALAAES